MKKIVFLVLVLTMLGLAKASLAACGDPLIDSRDKKTYRTVNLGGACWMKDNLKYETNVDNVQKNNGDVFYTWHDAMANSETAGARGLCPVGWHIPTEAEWVSALNVAGRNACATIDDAWKSYHCPNTSRAIRSLLDINKLTYGMKSYAGIYWYANNTTLYWTSTKVKTDVDYIKNVLIDYKAFGDLADSVFTDSIRKSWDAGSGYYYNAVRCVQDGSSVVSTVTCYADNDDDGYGNQSSPKLFTGSTCSDHYAKTAGDCNDNNADVRPNLAETCANKIDDNCNGQIDEGCSVATDACPATLVDSRDQKTYATVNINGNCWMAEDLKYESNVWDVKKNGTDVFYSWRSAMAGAVTEKAQGVCPAGWHIPTEAEWLTLAQDVSGETCQRLNDAWGSYYCTKAGSYLKSKLNINKFFYGLKASSSDSTIRWIRGNAQLWSSSLKRLNDSSEYIKYAYLVQNDTNPSSNNYFYTDITRKSWDDQGYQYQPVRCLKNQAVSDGSSSSGSNALTGTSSSLTCYRDADKDNFGLANNSRVVTGASCPTGYTKAAGECNDNNSKVNPNVQEVCGNNVDENCNGRLDENCAQLTCYTDADADTFGNLKNSKVFFNVSSCPARYTNNSNDCNDSNKNIKPGSAEVCGNKVDDNCNGQVDEGCINMTCYRDTDGDSFGALNARREFKNVSQCGSGYVGNASDCNDRNKNINPAARETCANKIDDNCNGKVDEDC